MSTHVQFVHLAKTQALEDFTREKIEAVLERFLGRSTGSKAQLKMENSPQQAGKDVFHCEIEIDDKQLGPERLHIRESAVNLYQAIYRATHKLKNVLSRYKAKRSDHNRSKARKSKRNRVQVAEL